MMVDDTDIARDVLRRAKMRISEEEMIIVWLDNRPGAFGELAKELAQSKTNIECAYASTSPFAWARGLLAVPDVARALRVLGE